MYLLQYTSEKQAEAACKNFSDDPLVDFVQPNKIVHVDYSDYYSIPIFLQMSVETQARSCTIPP
jgi:hypothetical protein